MIQISNFKNWFRNKRNRNGSCRVDRRLPAMFLAGKSGASKLEKTGGQPVRESQIKGVVCKQVHGGAIPWSLFSCLSL